MAREHELPPSAASLSASLRDIGYSLEAAVADLVDNSIAAGGLHVGIRCDLTLDPPTLVVHDDGCGMTPEDLVFALRHGGKGPRAARAATDLGRFGLGLKTASFSQCKRLTVVSSQAGCRCAAMWDLDVVEAEDRWVIAILDEQEIAEIPHIDLLPPTGTLVVWQKLDRLFEGELDTHLHELVNEKLEVLRWHLSLVFHRFLSGDANRPKLSISVNNLALEPFDPFCTKHRSTQKLPLEYVDLGEHRVRIQAYVLPHHARLTNRDYELYRTRSDFISHQGAYIYRNCRLMAWGDWFRLVPKGEATKLARVQIDFSSAQDEEWTIDIKKSRARPPREVRDRVKALLPQITGRSARVFRGRGLRLWDDLDHPLWHRFADQDRIRYAVNRDHPTVSAVRQRLDEPGQRALDLLLDSIGTSLPVEMLYSDYSTHAKFFDPQKLPDDDAEAKLRELKLLLFADAAYTPEEFKQAVASTGLFRGHESLVDAFANGRKS